MLVDFVRVLEDLRDAAICEAIPGEFCQRMDVYRTSVVQLYFTVRRDLESPPPSVIPLSQTWLLLRFQPTAFTTDYYFSKICKIFNPIVENQIKVC